MRTVSWECQKYIKDKSNDTAFSVEHTGRKDNDCKSVLCNLNSELGVGAVALIDENAVCLD